MVEIQNNAAPADSSNGVVIWVATILLIAIALAAYFGFFRQSPGIPDTGSGTVNVELNTPSLGGDGDGGSNTGSGDSSSATY